MDVTKTTSLYPETFDYFDTGFQSFDSTVFLNLKPNQYLFRNSSIADTYCPMEGQVQNYINSLPPLGRRLTDTTATNSTGALNLTVLNIWLERRSESDLGVYDPIFADMFLSLDLTGDVYYPPGEDISILPNGGFAPGETADSIAGTIYGAMLESLIYYKWPGILSSLETMCVATCSAC